MAGLKLGSVIVGMEVPEAFAGRRHLSHVWAVNQSDESLEKAET
jgi:hypothetical protein